MNKNFKRILSALLALVMCISFVNAAFALEGENDEPLPEKPVVKTLDDYDTVVTMYLCATANSVTGHLWLYFVNNTECEVPLGYVTLLPGEGMSVSSLSVLHKSGGGTYYNAEVMMANDHLDEVAKHTVSLKMDLTLEELEKVNNKIRSLNFYELIFWNCGCFATQVWNCVSKKDVVHITMPFIAIINMYILGGEKGQIRMQETTIDRAFKQKSGGVVQADERSFRTSCVG